jgi:hypothetical protein
MTEFCHACFRPDGSCDRKAMARRATKLRAEATRLNERADALGDTTSKGHSLRSDARRAEHLADALDAGRHR